MDKSAAVHGLSARKQSFAGPLTVLGNGAQLDPLFPGYPFDLQLVAGLTAIVEGGALDFMIDRPNGMKGYIVNMTVQGCGQVFEGDACFSCRRGDLLLFAPEAQHLYGRAAGSPEWFHRWVYFQPRGFWAPWLTWPDTVRGVGRLTLQGDALIDEFEQLFAQIDATRSSGRRTAELLAINQLERLLIRCHEECPQPAPAPPDARVQAACQFIARHLAQDLSLDEIGRAVRLSPSRLAQLFRDQTGMTIVRWREDQRLLLARQLLQTSDTPVCTISALVGYDDQLYFSRVFRKRLGVSPTEFRRRL